MEELLRFTTAFRPEWECTHDNAPATSQDLARQFLQVTRTRIVTAEKADATLPAGGTVKIENRVNAAEKRSAERREAVDDQIMKRVALIDAPDLDAAARVGIGHKI